MDRRRAAGALLALAACIACSTAAPTASNQTALELLEGPTEGCYYNFQHYGEGDRIMTNEPCLNCTCHNRMLMCYLRVCPFTKPIGQDCTIEKRADQCCPIVTCPDVPVDLLTSTSTSYPAEYGATGVGKVDKYGCSINGKYFPEGSKVPPTPNKPCEHCYCIRNMTTCVMQECTLHVDGCTPIYNKDVCCPVRYSCDHQEDEMLLLDDMTTTVRPTPGFLLTTTTMASVTQMSQDCVHDDQIFTDGALIKTEKACEHCYCMKGDIVCVVQECGTPMENEGKNCTSLAPRQGQCCPDTYICEGDEMASDVTADIMNQDLITTLSPPRRVEGSGYRNEPDEPTYTEMTTFEGSGEEQATTLDTSDLFTPQKQTPEIIDEVFAATEESLKPNLSTIEPDKGLNTVPDDSELTPDHHLTGLSTAAHEEITATQPALTDSAKETETITSKTTISDYHYSTVADTFTTKDNELFITTESALVADNESTKIAEVKPDSERVTSTTFINIPESSTPHLYIEPSSTEYSVLDEKEKDSTTSQTSETLKEEEEVGISQPKATTTKDLEKDIDYVQTTEYKQEQYTTVMPDKDDVGNKATVTEGGAEAFETTSINPVENEIDEDILPISPPGRIPGEGDCLLNGITYQNNTSVPNTNNCHSSCKCVSSIIKCDPIICSPPPEHMDNMSDCQPVYDTPDACCPTYVCHSRETVPPESHSQMSGTDSPNLSSDKHDIGCHGDECKTNDTPITTMAEPCNSEDCQTVNGDQVEKCKNGACETSSNTSPPLSHSEGCTGDNCLSSEHSCTDGKCQQPTSNEKICNNENGCQPSQSETCEGHDCEMGSEITIPKDEKPLCENPGGCSEDASETSKPSCEGNLECDSTISDKSETQVECTEEGCRRQEQTQTEHKLSSECSGSDCLTQEVIKDDQSSKESTTEITQEGPSRSTEPEESVTVYEEQKVTQFEVKPTEKQDSSIEMSTEKTEDMTVVAVTVHDTVKEEPVTQSFDSHVTNKEEATTELYNKPEIESSETFMPQVDTSKSTHTTESLEHITKEILTESPFITQYEEHTTDSLKEDVSSMPEKHTELSPTFVTTTVTPEEPHDSNKLDANKEDATDKVIGEDSPLSHEPSTESPNTLVTLIESELGATLPEQEYSKKEEIYTESPEIHTVSLDEIPVTTSQEPSKIVTQETISTESDLNGAITEPSVIIVPEKSTEKQLDDNLKEHDVTNVVDTDDANVLYTTEHPMTLEQSFDTQTTKLDDHVTSKVYDDTQKEQFATEIPNTFNEKTPFESTTYGPYVTVEESLSPQTTDKQTLPDNLDIGMDNTEPSTIDQQKLTQTPVMHEMVSDKQDAHITPEETSSYVTSSISLDIDKELPSTTKINLETEPEIDTATEKDETNLPQSPVKETTNAAIAQDSDVKEISTQNPETTITILQEATLDANKVSAEISIPLEEETVNPVQDFTEPILHYTTLPIHTTKIPEEIFQEDTTLKYSVAPELHDQSISTEVTETEKQKEPSTPLPYIEPVSVTETTISSIISDHGTSTKLEPIEEHNEYNDENTLIPGLLTTSSEKSTVLSEETDKDASDTSTIKSEESDIATTERSIEPDVQHSELPEKTPIISEPAINENPIKEDIEPSVMEVTEEQPYIDITHVPDQTDTKKPISVPVGDLEPEGTLVPTTSNILESEKQPPEQYETELPEDHVTEKIYDKDKDSGENIHITPYYPGSYETDKENTHASPETTQSQDSETKSVTESEVKQTSTPSYVIKEEEKPTESPMSLVTEITEELPSSPSVHYEDNSIIDRTTKLPLEPEEETSISGTHDIEQQKPQTESPGMEEYDSKTPTQTYPEIESHPVSSSTILSTEYTTTNIIDSNKEKITSSPISEDGKIDTSTEFSEKYVPTSKYDEETTYIGPEIHSEVDDAHKTTTAPPLIASSEETIGTIVQELTTIYPEISVPVTTSLYEKDADDTEAQHKPIHEDSAEKHTEEPLTDVGSTTIESTKVTYGDLQQQEHEITVEQVDEHTTLPNLLTTKYAEMSDNDSKDVSQYETNKQEENVTSPDDHIVTDGLNYTERPVSSEVELHSTSIQDEEIFTKKPQIIDTETEQTTPLYQDLNTIKEEPTSDVPELHLSTIDTLPTESSHIILDKEDHRRTQSPVVETIQPEQFVTEKQTIPPKEQTTVDLSEITKTHDTAETYTTEVISTHVPEKERVSLVTVNEQSPPEHVTHIPQATEDELLLPTKSHDDQDMPADTENVEKYTTEAQDITIKPVYTDSGDNEDLQTKLPLFEQNYITEKTTADKDLLNIPRVTVPVVIPPEPETEIPILKEPDTETSIYIDKQTESSLPIESETETNVPKETEFTMPIEVETDISIPKEPEPSVPTEAETETYLPKEPESSIPVQVEAETPVPKEPESSVPVKTVTSAPIATETLATKVTVTSEEIENETESYEPVNTESSVPKVTETETESYVSIEESKGTEASLPKETEVLVPIETETITLVPAETTYPPNYEKLPEELPTTSEPIHSSSETTPYLVELQEHTNKIDSDISSVIPTDIYTKGPEIYQTERGDQPLDSVTDKPTAEDFHEKHTTEGIFTLKEEKLTTISQVEPSEYPAITKAPEDIPHKTEIVTEDSLISSESSSSAPSETPISESTDSSYPIIIPAVPVTTGEHEQPTTDFRIETTTVKKDLSLDTEKVSGQEVAHETTAPEDELIPTVAKTTTIKSPDESTTHFPISQDKYSKPQDKPAETYPQTTVSDLPKPDAIDTQPTEELPSPDFPSSGSSGYGQEPDYVEEDQAFGPGTCRYGGKVYVSAQQIPRDDPCDFCFCFRSDIICLQQSCPPPIHGCHEEPIQGFCCPRYECPVSMATTLNVTTTTTTTTTTLPPHFLPHAYKGAAQRRGCQIKGHTYKVGDVVRASSGPCLHCTCGGDGQMKCDPKACTPEPMLRQMIAAAVSAKRRR